MTARKASVRAPQVKVEVTREMIADATRGDSGHCMIAEAIKAAVPAARFVSVDLQTIRFTDREQGLRFTYLTPRRGMLALIDFDQGREPEPFSIRLIGGQVTLSGRAATGDHRPLKPGTIAAIREWATTQEEWADKVTPRGHRALPEGLRGAYAAAHPRVTLGRARLVKHHGSDGSIPEIVGGRTPPVGALAGGFVPPAVRIARRRQFGIRALER
jgi:hypothetical protein